MFYHICIIINDFVRPYEIKVVHRWFSYHYYATKAINEAQIYYPYWTI